jgi:hypothetical protein
MPGIAVVTRQEAERWDKRYDDLEEKLVQAWDALGWLGRWWIRRTDPDIEGIVVLARLRRMPRG